MYDASPKAIGMIRDFLRQIPQTFDDMERLMNRNRIFVGRTRGVGHLTKAAAINRGCSGPVARASGVTRDLRKDEPYLNYRDFDFQVCCAEEGDCFARYLVRMAEMRESVKIVHQAIENLPGGPGERRRRGRGDWSICRREGVFAPRRPSENKDLSPAASRVILPRKGVVSSTIEGWIEHFELVMTTGVFRRRARKYTVPPRPPTANWAFTSSATAARRPIGPAADRPR